MYVRYSIGKEGEELAANFLKQKGYQILEKNFSCKQGEIDIIAKDKGEYVFIEVKTRRNRAYGLPVDAVHQNKIRHMKNVIQYYLYKNKIEGNYIRIDVIEIYKTNKRIKIHHIKQAI